MTDDKNHTGSSAENLPLTLKTNNQEERERFFPFILLFFGFSTLGFAFEFIFHGDMNASSVFFGIGISSMLLYIFLAIFGNLNTICWLFTLILMILFYYFLLYPRNSYNTELFGCLGITPGFVAALGWRRGAAVLLFILFSMFAVFYTGLVDIFISDYPDVVIERFIVCFIGLSGYTIALDYSRHASFRYSVGITDQYKTSIRNDPLTGVLNRQEFKKILRREYYKFISTGSGFFLALVDIDDLKNYNSRYGTEFGDQVIQLVGNALHNEMRRDDFVARWADDDFMVIFKGNGDFEAVKVIERIKERLSEKNINAGGGSITVSVSAVVLHVTQTSDLDSMLDVVEKELSKAKNQGKNQLIHI